MRTFDTTHSMDKDMKRMKKRGMDLAKLKTAVEKLCLGDVLEPRYKKHPLSGEWVGYFDIHIEADWVLIYSADENSVHLIRTGTHADLFE